MSAGVFAIVLMAAFLHAGWNALVKGGADKTAAMIAVVLGQGLVGLIVIAFTQMPTWASWPWLLLGVVLHVGYQFFLVSAYRLGDLTQVYPIARGVSPLIVSVVSALFLGVVLSTGQWLSIALIAVGISSFSLVRRSDGVFEGKALGLALITGSFIASYSLADGVGARLSGAPLGYYGWMAMLNGLLVLVWAAIWRRGLMSAVIAQPRTLILGGGASFGAYALVVYAFTLAPIALVTALRETSIVFALAIGTLFLNERLGPLKIIAALVTLSGVVLLRFSGG